MHPRSKHWHLIDYVIIRKRDRQDMQVTRAMCGAKCWTDHHLIISKLNLCIQPKRHPQGMKTPKCLNVNKLKLSCIKQSLTDTLEECLDATTLDNQDMESAWADNTAVRGQTPCLQSPPWWSKEYSKRGCTKKHQQHYPTKAVPNAGFMAEQQSWWDPRLCR